MKRLGIATVMTLVLSCGGVGSGGVGSSDAVTLGAVAPWGTGYGTQIRRAIELAVEEINKGGGINGKDVKVVFKDDSANGARGVAMAQELVADKSIVAVIGHANSVVSVASARVYDGNIAAISPSSSSPALTGVSPWVFRTINSDSLNGIELAKFATRRGHKRAALMYENDAFGRGLVAVFKRAFDGQVVGVDPISAATRDFEPFVSYYKKVKPDLVFVVGTEVSGVAFIKEARRQQLDAELLGADGWSGVTIGGALMDGVVIGAPFSTDSPRPQAQKFVATFKAKYNTLPDGFAACAYDAVMLVARAIREVGPDRQKVRDWLASMRDDYDGVTGRFKLGANGDPMGKTLVMTRMKNGVFTVEGGQ